MRKLEHFEGRCVRPRTDVLYDFQRPRPLVFVMSTGLCFLLVWK